VACAVCHDGGFVAGCWPSYGPCQICKGSGSDDDRVCAGCDGTGATFARRHAIDACPACARIAEAEWQAELHRQTALAAE
jgi:hypothetical protein